MQSLFSSTDLNVCSHVYSYQITVLSCNSSKGIYVTIFCIGKSNLIMISCHFCEFEMHTTLKSCGVLLQKALFYSVTAVLHCLPRYTVLSEKAIPF